MEIADVQVLELQGNDSLQDIQGRTYFELLFFKRVQGILEINTCRYPLTNDHLFVLSPDDRYHLETSGDCRLHVIRFSLDALRMDPNLSQDWTRDMEYALFHHYRNKGCIWSSKEEKNFAEVLLKEFMLLYSGDRANKAMLIRQILALLLSLIVDNLRRHLIAEDGIVIKNNREHLPILDYIQRNIYFPEKLTIAHLAKTFHLSEHYIGAFFKEKQGQSIQDFIIDYRLKLICARLSTGHKRIKEIAQEFGFSSEAYLGRFFKQRMHRTPMQYRKESSNIS